MFKLKREPQHQKLVTVIGKQTYCQGIVETAGGLRIDGRVDGRASADAVIVGDNGEVKGDINAKAVIVSGKVKGNIVATEYLEMHAKCQINGDIQTRKLSIAEGAILNGKCTMIASVTENEAVISETEANTDILEEALSPAPVVEAEN